MLKLLALGQTRIAQRHISTYLGAFYDSIIT